MNIETLRGFLKGAPNLAEVSRRSGVSVRTLFRLRDDPNAGVNLSTAAKIVHVMDGRYLSSYQPKEQK